MPQSRFKRKQAARAKEAAVENVPPSLLSLQPIIRWARIPAVVVVCVVMLKLDYKTIRETGLEGLTTNTQNSTTSATDKLSPAVTDKAQPQTTSAEQQQTPDTTLHSTHTAVLGLLDWEQESLEGITTKLDHGTIDWNDPSKADRAGEDSCRPPNGIRPQCCLGTFSSGGAIDPKIRWRCGEPLQEGLERVKEAAERFYNDNPLAEDDQMRCDVCRIVELAHRRSLHVVFLGDSMHGQVFSGLDCELQRRNYEVDRSFVQQDTSAEGPYNRKHTTSTFLKVRSPEWAEGQTVAITYHMVYAAPLCPGCGDLASLTADADVVVLGFGLHWWNSAFLRYVQDMASIFRMVRDQGRAKLLVQRETTAQHFDGEGGGFEFFEKKGEEERDISCMAFRMDDLSVYWREKAVLQSAQRSGLALIPAGPSMPPYDPTSQDDKLSEVVSLPYFHFTAPMAHMHPSDKKPGLSKQDCTHYCGSPFVYQPLWRSLRLAMDRRFSDPPPKQR